MSTFDDTQNLLDRLRAQQIEVEARTARLVERRKVLVSLPDDQVVRKRLDALNTEITTNANEIERIRAAIVQESARLSEIQQSDLEKAELERIRSSSERARELRASAAELDAAVALLAQKYAAFRRFAGALRVLGFTKLTNDFVNSAARRALHSHLQGTGLSLEAIPPSHQQTFGSLAESWTAALTPTDATTSTVRPTGAKSPTA